MLLNNNTINIITLFFIAFFCTHTLASEKHESKEFDSLYFNIATDIATRDLQRAFVLADSLYVHTKSPVLKLRARMLTSTLHQKAGRLPQAIFNAQDAMKLAKKGKEYEWMARISGFLSTQYRHMEMYSEGKRYLEEGREIIQKVEGEEMQNLYQGMLDQELAYYAYDQNQYSEAEELAEKADHFFGKLTGERNRNYFLATNFEFLGRINLRREEWDRALSSFTNALQELEKVTDENITLRALINSGIGKAYLEKDSLDLALYHLTKAKDVAETSGMVALKQTLYSHLSTYYDRIEDLNQYVHYTNLYTEVYQEAERQKKSSIDNFINEKKKIEANLKANINYLLMTSMLLGLLFLVLLIIFLRNQKNEKKRFQALMAKLETEKPLVRFLPNDENEEETEEVKEEEEKRMMSEETEQAILNGLEQFETTKKFLQSNISLSHLASYLKTNNKYLSHVLNSNKNQNFNAYINELKVRYIIEKLKNDKQYRTYKISYLAEECGYSSHSKFSQSFKSVTGMLPSVFIKQLDNE